MHELAVCQSLIREVERAAAANRAVAAVRVAVAIGPLSGVDGGSLARAFEIARADTVAAQAVLEIETVPVRVGCAACGHESEVPANALVCARCGNWRVELKSGDELLLKSVELELGRDRVDLN